MDAKGLVALWRESLLAKKVLEGNTKGYKFHPQLIRFRDSVDPIISINTYLFFVLEEARARGYSFNREKIVWEKCSTSECLMEVTTGQIYFEGKHLLCKLLLRDRERYEDQVLRTHWEPHPLFKIVEGEIEAWEKDLKGF